MPWSAYAAWFYAHMVLWGQTVTSPAQYAKAQAVLRPDLYLAALREVNPALQLPSETAAYPGDFFDGRPFDPSSIETFLRSFSPAQHSS